MLTELPAQKGSAKEKELRRTRNEKYEITDIVHKQYPFLHRVRALRDIGAEVRAGDLGGFVESESNLSFEPGDAAWMFNDAIACNSAYVDQGAVLRDSAIACHSAYVSKGAVLSGQTRAEDEAYIRGAVMSGCARASGHSVILQSPDTHTAPMLFEHCVVCGKVSGDVHIFGTSVVCSGDEVCNDTPDRLIILDGIRSFLRDPARDRLVPSRGLPEPEKAKKREVSR